MAIELASGGEQDILRPRIVVVGVGGGGCNAVNNMIDSGLQGIEFLAANTDAQSLAASKAQRKLQLGTETTAGLGSGAKPDVGRRAAQESIEDIRDALAGCNMLFIAAGMGGGTGTGAAAVFAEVAESMGILTIAVVTKPFEFEGVKRMNSALEGIEELQKFVGTIIIIPNQNLFRLANEKTTFADAFKMADDVLCSGVRGITDLIIVDGLVNLDFADIRTVMSEMGKAMMGTGEAEGDDRSIRAAEAAITNPLLEDTSLRGAKEVMVNITAGRDVGLQEVDEVVNRIRREAGEDAYVHFGTALDETMHGIMRVSVVATGIEGSGQQKLALDSYVEESALSPNVSLSASAAEPVVEPVVEESVVASGPESDLESDVPKSPMVAEEPVVAEPVVAEPIPEPEPMPEPEVSPMPDVAAVSASSVGSSVAENPHGLLPEVAVSAAEDFGSSVASDSAIERDIYSGVSMEDSDGLGVPDLDVPNLDVPNLDVPSVNSGDDAFIAPEPQVADSVDSGLSVPSGELDPTPNVEAGVDSVAVGADEGSSESSGRGNIFSRWRSGGVDESVAVGSAEAEPEVESESEPESELSAEVEDDVVIFQERRFLPEEDVDDEGEADSDDSNLRRIPAFFRR